MIRWFGPSWGAPVCDPEFHIELPMRRTCIACKEPFESGAQGMQVPLVDGTPAEPRASICYWHLDCMLENIGVRPRRELSGPKFPPCCETCNTELPRSSTGSVSFDPCPRHPRSPWYYRLQEPDGIYPAGWRMCRCGKAVLEGHDTCGDAICGLARRHQHAITDPNA